MAQRSFTWPHDTDGVCKWHALGACKVDPVAGRIVKGQQYTWKRASAGEHWHVECPSDAALPAFPSKYPGRCGKCAGTIAVGDMIRWRPSTHEVFHLECPTSASNATPNATPQAANGASDLEARLKASIEAATAARATNITSPVPMHAPSPDNDNAEAALLAAMRAMMEARTPKAAPLDESRVLELIAAHAPKPPTIRVEVTTPSGVRTFDGQHKNFAALLRKCSARDGAGNRLNVWLTGPAGTGKTTAAHRCAEALDVPFFAQGSIQDPTQLIGYVSPVTGQYMSTAFRRAFENGGLMLLDEIDASDPNALLTLNQALANSAYMFPDGALVQRHTDFVCVCAANTYGLGGTHDYVGRMKQDAAFLDRFVSQDWPIDEDLETRLAGNEQWSKYVQGVRARALAKGVRVVISPRASILGAALLAVGESWEAVCAATLRRGMTAEMWDSIKGEGDN